MEVSRRSSSHTSSLRTSSGGDGTIRSKEEAELQRFLLRFLAICCMISTFVCASITVRLISGNFWSHSEEQRKFYMTHFANNIYITVLCISSGIYVHKFGVTIYATCAMVFGFMIAICIMWLFTSSGEFLQFASMLVVLLIVVGRTRHHKFINRLVYVVIVLFVIAISLEAIDKEFDIGLHPLGRSMHVSNIMLWACYVAPIVANCILLKLYVSAVLRQEQCALKSVEVAYKIADKLANFDLDAAEKLIGSNTRLSGVDEDVVEPLSRLLNHLRSYSAFLPESLFSMANGEALENPPNRTLSKLMRAREPSWKHIECAVSKLLEPSYTLGRFRADMCAAYPELTLYSHSDEKMTSGRSTNDEYERTLSALYSFYCLLRLDIDGKYVFCYGVGDDGRPVKEPIGDGAKKKIAFYDDVPWETLTDLLLRAELISVDEKGEVSLNSERVISMLALTAIHDIMKNKALLPRLDPRHAPFRGYGASDEIGDHDIALEYILEHFPALLPSYKILGPRQRAPILFSQSKMGFNHGHLVQAEAPPGDLFTRFKKVIREGRASKCDINFYFVHWFTDLAGAEPFNDRPWPGAEKFTVKFPVQVLTAFLESFSFIDNLAVDTEVETFENYLVSRYTGLGSSAAILPSHSEIALMRLTLMAQDFETHAIADAYARISRANRVMLSEELARTGCREQFRRAPSKLHIAAEGPAILVYYAPALLQLAGPTQYYDALRILAAVFRSTRLLFPLTASRAEETVTVRIDALKVLSPKEILKMMPWHVYKTSNIDGEVQPGPPPSVENTVALQIELPTFSL